MVPRQMLGFLFFAVAALPLASAGRASAAAIDEIGSGLKAGSAPGTALVAAAITLTLARP